MLSRTAESLFWIGRYMERADATARLIANPVAHKLKAEAMDDLVARIREGTP